MSCRTSSALALVLLLVGGAMLLGGSALAQSGPLGSSPTPQSADQDSWPPFALRDGPPFRKERGPLFKKGGGPLFKKEGGPPSKKDAARGLGPKSSGPKIGDRAPDFELRFLDSTKTFKLSDNFGQRPSVLIFHSFT